MRINTDTWHWSWPIWAVLALFTLAGFGLGWLLYASPGTGAATGLMIGAAVVLSFIVNTFRKFRM